MILYKLGGSVTHARTAAPLLSPTQPCGRTPPLCRTRTLAGRTRTLEALPPACPYGPTSSCRAPLEAGDPVGQICANRSSGSPPRSPRTPPRPGSSSQRPPSPRSPTPSTGSRSAAVTPTPPPTGPMSPLSSTTPASFATLTRTSSPYPSLLAGSGIERRHCLPPLSASAAPSPPAPGLEATTMPLFPSRRAAGPAWPAKMLGLFRPARPKKWPDRPCLGRWPGPVLGSARPGRHDVLCWPDHHQAMPGTGLCSAEPGRPDGHLYL